MKEVTQVVYEAFDGSVFKTERECADHEKNIGYRRLVGLTEEDLINALAGNEPDLAEALKTFGYRLARLNPTGKRAAKRKADKNDNEPELPEPVGRAPMTAEEAERQVRA